MQYNNYEKIYRKKSVSGSNGREERTKSLTFWVFELLEGTIKGITERKLVHGFAVQQCQSLRTGT